MHRQNHVCKPPLTPWRADTTRIQRGYNRGHLPARSPLCQENRAGSLQGHASCNLQYVHCYYYYISPQEPPPAAPFELPPIMQPWRCLYAALEVSMCGPGGVLEVSICSPGGVCMQPWRCLHAALEVSICNPGGLGIAKLKDCWCLTRHYHAQCVERLEDFGPGHCKSDRLFAFYKKPVCEICRTFCISVGARILADTNCLKHGVFLILGCKISETLGRIFSADTCGYYTCCFSSSRQLIGARDNN